MKKTLTLLLALALLCALLPCPADASSDGLGSLEPEKAALVIGGNQIKNGDGFLKSFVCLTESELNELYASPSGETTYKLGLGDCFSELMTYSTFEDHGTPTWIYRRVYGLDIRAMAEALGVDTSKAVSVFAASSDGMTKSLPDAFNADIKRYSFSTDGNIENEVTPIIALFETTSESTDSARPGSAVSLPPAPALGSDSPDRTEPVFGYGQTAADEINSCYWVKYLTRLRIGGEDSAITVTGADGAEKSSSISGIVQNGIYSYTLTAGGKTARLTGQPLTILLGNMGVSLSNDEALIAESADGSTRTYSYSELSGVFAAWYATEDGAAVNNTTALRLYNTDGTAFADLKALTVTDKTQNHPFTDMVGYEWADDAVSALYSAGIISGVGGGRFDPSANIKRGDFILMLARALNLKSDTRVSFSDVPETQYYAEAIAAAKSLGIAQGNGSRFYPETALTRQEAMTLIYRALKLTGADIDSYSGSLGSFSDAASVASWALAGVRALVGAGIINGDGGRILPEGSMTRAEMSAALYRALTAFSQYI